MLSITYVYVLSELVHAPQLYGNKHKFLRSSPFFTIRPFEKHWVLVGKIVLVPTQMCHGFK